MDQVQTMHNELVNAKASLQVEKQRFEGKQLEYEQMQRLCNSLEESKSKQGGGISIAGVRADSSIVGGGGSGFEVPLEMDNNFPPSYVTAQVKAHDNGG